MENSPFQAGQKKQGNQSRESSTHRPPFEVPPKLLETARRLPVREAARIWENFFKYQALGRSETEARAIMFNELEKLAGKEHIAEAKTPLLNELYPEQSQWELIGYLEGKISPIGALVANVSLPEVIFPNLPRFINVPHRIGTPEEHQQYLIRKEFEDVAKEFLELYETLALRVKEAAQNKNGKIQLLAMSWWDELIKIQQELPAPLEKDISKERINLYRTKVETLRIIERAMNQERVS